MICEALNQFDIRRIRKLLGADLPEVFTLGSVTFRTTTTDCHLGGQRQWFMCPECGRRCAILYPVRCRKCVGAHYRTEHASVEQRKIIKALRQRAALGQKTGGLLASFPSKPKGMHQRTYDRLRRDAKALEAEIWRDTGAFLERLTGQES